MTRDELLLEIGRLLEADSALTGPEELSSLASWDSLAVLSFIAMADDKAGVILPPNKISACKRVDDLVALVC